MAYNDCMATTKASALDVWLSMSDLVMDHKSYWAMEFAQHLDVPFSRYRAMRRIVLRPWSQRELAEAMRIDAPAASVIVSDLCARGWATRGADPDDGRRKVIEATELGRAWVQEVRSLPQAPAMFEALSADERRELARLLEKLRAAAR